MNRKLVVTLSNGTQAQFFDAETRPVRGFELHEFSIEECGGLTIYFHTVNEWVDITRNIAAYAPGQWREVLEVTWP